MPFSFPHTNIGIAINSDSALIKYLTEATMKIDN